MLTTKTRPDIPADIFLALLCLGITLSTASQAQNPAEVKQREAAAAQAAPIKALPSAPAAPLAPTAGPGKALGNVFAGAGVVSCAPRVEEIGNFLLQDGESGAFLFLPESAPDQRQVGVSLEIVSPRGGSAYASADFSHELGGGCGASYQALAYWPASCTEVARISFPTNKFLGVLKRDILMLELSKLGRIFLMPAGPGCVSIKRELTPSTER